jgi:hypothetical protein
VCVCVHGLRGAPTSKAMYNVRKITCDGVAKTCVLSLHTNMHKAGPLLEIRKTART